jgi:hypothetical protein
MQRGICLDITITMVLAILMGVPMYAGCGHSGPPRFEVSGKATFAGRPIPAGKILFEPDEQTGNTGPRGMALIKGGVYRTLPGEGAAGGPQVVRIYGFDGAPPPQWPNSPLGIPIFRRYDTKVNLPQEPATCDFEVPKSAEFPKGTLPK